MEFPIAIRVLEGENDMYLDEMFGIMFIIPTLPISDKTV